MRKRNIKSVAHWVIMSVVLLFPILMVGISSFASKQQTINVEEKYEYQTNEVNSIDDLIVGNIYHYVRPKETINTTITVFLVNADMIYNKLTNYQIETKPQENWYMTFRVNNGNYYIYQRHDDTYIYLSYINQSAFDENIDFYFVLHDTEYFDNVTINYVSESDYLGEKTITYDIQDLTMREDVNQWCASFRSLPVNKWYDNLLVAIGLGITTSMMMNVIYTYPLYVLWVYILDLIVDIFLVIINFGHNALKRLGGDNE